MNIWIVTPTYNERLNLATHVATIFRYLPQAKVLIVDDASPDGTGKLADELSQTTDRIVVRHRAGKLGLGTAYAEGCAQAIAAGADIVVQLDADGSHPPELLPAMVAMTERADLVLASRYVRGGSMRIDPFRRLVSEIGNSYIRGLLGRRIHDWSTGYKAWRAPFLQDVLSRQPSSSGYAWLMETSWLALKAGARVVEIPLVFGRRHAGQSKFSWAIAVEDLKVAWRLRRAGLATGRKK